MQEGFDVEGVSGGWLEDIQQEWPLAPEPTKEGNDGEGMENGVARGGAQSAVGMYEEWVPHASVGLQIAEREGDDTVVEVESEDAQAFLGEQSRVLEAMRAKAAEADRERDAAKGVRKGEEVDVGRGSVVADHIGPVQFNMGGIQVDADDMLQRIKVSSRFPQGRRHAGSSLHAIHHSGYVLTGGDQDRQEYNSAEDPTTPPPDARANAGDSAGLEEFFQKLMDRKPAGSAGGSPAQ